MPMIVFSFTQGAFRSDQKPVVASRLLDVFVKHHVASKLSAQLRSVTCFKIHEYEPGTLLIGDRIPEKHRYDIEVVVPEGTLEGDRSKAMMEEFARVLLDIEGTPWSREDAERVWCLVRPVPDSHWIIGGTAMTAKSILKRLIQMKIDGFKGGPRAAA
jgi:phenylpyruvate tautomerase PptA (4-oxalocrotonate tautomerase family)